MEVHRSGVEEGQMNIGTMMLGLKSAERVPGQQLHEIHSLLRGWIESEILQLVHPVARSLRALRTVPRKHLEIHVSDGSRSHSE